MKEIFEDQIKFTEKVFGQLNNGMPEKYEDKVAWTKQYLLCIVSECIEVLNELDWKHHKVEDKILDINNVGIELIDIQKYLWGLSRIWEIDYNKFIELYKMKTIEVESTWLQNHEIPNISKVKNVCIIDIDGVLNDYPECFYRWVKNTYTISKKILIENLIEREKYKTLYRLEGGKLSCNPNIDSIKALNMLKAKDYVIVLLTNRPYKKFKRIYHDTITWLNNNKVIYDYIFWAEDKKIYTVLNKCKDIKFVVDDSIDTCKDFSKIGIKSYNFGTQIKSMLEIEELK